LQPLAELQPQPEPQLSPRATWQARGATAVQPGAQLSAPSPGAAGLVTPPDQGNGQAVASLVFGILSILFCWLGLLGVAMVILAIAFGIIGILRVRLGFSSGLAAAIAGVALAVAGLGLYLGFGVAGLGLGFRVLSGTPAG
jgi:hypothetical protein